MAKRADTNSLQYRIADAVEASLIKNHQDMLTIIDTYTYLAEPDAELTLALNQYTKNVFLYLALRQAGDQTTFPYDIDPTAKYPDTLYPLIKQRTESYQQRLNRLMRLLFW